MFDFLETDQDFESGTPGPRFNMITGRALAVASRKKLKVLGDSHGTDKVTYSAELLARLHGCLE
jgi:hypothetical protein